MLKRMNCYRICTSLLLVCLVCFVYGDAIGADIFGLKKGMTVSQIRALDFGTLERFDNDLFFVSNPKMPKDAWMATFEFSPKDGLLKVRLSFRIETNAYGHKVKEKYREMRDIMRKKYGKGKEIDALLPSSIWNESSDWMMGLLKGDRLLAWSKSFDADNKWQLDTVAVMAKATSPEVAVIDVIYEFQGWEEYIDAKEAKEASQF